MPLLLDELCDGWRPASFGVCLAAVPWLVEVSSSVLLVRFALSVLQGGGVLLLLSVPSALARLFVTVFVVPFSFVPSFVVIVVVFVVALCPFAALSPDPEKPVDRIQSR